MTTIAFRDGVMAADTRAYTGGRPPIGRKVKIQRLDDGTLIGCSSTTPGQGEAVIRWFAAGADPHNTPPGEAKTTLLAVKPNGEVYFASDSYNLSGPLSGDYFAIGSGDSYALGAMAMGASAERAVEVACDLDVWSEGPITTLVLGAA